MSDAGNIVYIASKKWVTALDSRTGNQLWETEVPGNRFLSSGFMTITADATGVYASRSGQVTALDPFDGTILWSRKTRGTGALPVVATLFSGTDSGQAVVAAAAQTQQSQQAASS